MREKSEVFDYYEAGAEIGRLDRGLGVVEFARTKEILSRYLNYGMTVYDVGGGVGCYADWLAGLGMDVTMFELAPAAVEYALSHQTTPYQAMTADARKLPAANESCDALLLMGPLYHLLQRESRLEALREARRVLRPGGFLFAAGISKFSSMTWAVSTYRAGNSCLDDSVYMNMIRGEMATGEHHRPKEYPGFLAQAYFHTPQELAKELEDAAFQVEELLAVEGCIGFTPMLTEKWADPTARERLLEVVRTTEGESSLMGISPHFLAIGKK